MSDAPRPSRRKSSPGKKSSQGKDAGLPLVPPDAGEQVTAHDGDLLDYQTLPVVALGGSAGSIQVLKEFFTHTPAATGFAYVVIMHLAPANVSMMPELLQAWTAMKVLAAEDATDLKADTVYVIPPGKHLTVNGNRLRLTDLQQEHGKRTVVDLFFRSLADFYGPYATAVVLSGVDGDGAIGIKRIKERGGLTIAQEPDEAEFNGMPNAAIGTGMVDWILPARIMPARIQSYRERGTRLRLPPEDGPQPGKPTGAIQDHTETLLHEVLVFLRMRTGHDFSHYKRAVILRRVSRRMQISGAEHLADYLNYLRTFPGEAGALIQDLLVSVTNFFRDRESFNALESHIPELFRNKKPGDTVRVWCPGCATGEEAYSMAILLMEYARTLETPPVLQVFACDLNKDAIQTARAGFYPATITADISEERLHSFFKRETNGYRVYPDLREMVLFASHDIIKNAPFSRMDLISCRNLLVYFNEDARARVLEIFNFALRPGGLLFLGSCETADGRDTLFTPLDSHHRIYRQRPAERAGLPLPSRLSEDAIQRVLSEHGRLKAPSFILPGRSFTAAGTPALTGGTQPAGENVNALDVHFRLLGRFGPPSLVVNADHDVVHLSENAHSFLQFPEGAPTRNLMGLVHPMLRLHLRAGLLRAGETGEPVEIPDRPVDLPAGSKLVNIHILPGGRTAPGHLLVLFEARTPDTVRAARHQKTQEALGPEAVVQQLEREVIRLNAELRATVEQYECSAEELKASNEEFQATNEELRSVAEELETSREELQSINEELTTVNSEFRRRAEELVRANSDLHNLMNATRIPTVFLDRKLQLMRYTPSAAPLFNLISSDTGRPITHLRQRIHYPELPTDAQEVLSTLTPVEREIRYEDRWLLARMMPYRTVEDSIAGLVLCFVDITERRNAEGALRESENRLRTLADAVPQIIWTNAGGGKANYFNQRWYEYSGLSFEESVGLGWQAIVHPDDARHSVSLWEKALMEGGVFDCEYRLRSREGHYRWFIARNVPMRNAQGAVAEWFGTATDIHGLKDAESALRQSEEQFRRAIEEAPIPVIMHAEDGQVLQISKTWTELTGYAPEDIPTFDAWLNLAYGTGADDVRSRMQDVFNGTVPALHEELDVTTATGETRRWALSASSPGILRDGRRFVVAIALDITGRICGERALRESQERLRLILENAREYAIFSMNPERTITSWNSGAQAILGFTQEEAVGQAGDCIFTPEDRAAGVPAQEAAVALDKGSSVDERWHIKKDGTRFWGSGMMTSMRDPQGGAIGFVKIFRDRTKEMEAREALEQNRLKLAEALRSAEQARAEAIAASQAKDHFLAVLSHELRTPLTPVLMAVQVLGADQSLPSKVLGNLAMIERSVLVEIQLVNDLLDVTTIANGKMEVIREPMDFQEAVQQAIEISGPDFEARDQRLSVELEPGEYGIHGDFRRLQQVVWNLLKNASKFTPRGGEIEIATRNERGRIVLDIRDNGAGFEPDARDRIFAPFEQEARSVTRRYGGLGLGLAIAKATVEAHGGTIRAWSAGPGTGALFRVELPAEDKQKSGV
ncbi:MAG: PAS domain S-box protein [Verrucomicrobiaceae bacterium]|nr:MAG: PAS domain S-box protein [Verrucomicrobiaceae bacterium]